MPRKKRKNNDAKVNASKRQKQSQKDTENKKEKGTFQVFGG